MADEDPVDVKPAIEESCKPKCVKYWTEYEACAERVKEKGDGHCTGQYFDFYHCIDACAAPKYFKTLK